MFMNYTFYNDVAFCNLQQIYFNKSVSKQAAFEPGNESSRAQCLNADFVNSSLADLSDVLFHVFDLEACFFLTVCVKDS